MSIINKMHQELKEHHDSSPMLSAMPAKKQKKRVLLFALISLLLASSIGLSYLIYDKEILKAEVTPVAKTPAFEAKKQIADVAVIKPTAVEVAEVKAVEVSPVASVEPSPTIINTNSKDPVLAITTETVGSAEPDVVAVTQVDEIAAEIVDPVAFTKPQVAPVQAVATTVTMVNKKTTTKLLSENTEKVNPVTPDVFKKEVFTATSQEKVNVRNEKTETKPVSRSHLEIKKSILSDAQLADIHLKQAQKHVQKGDTGLAAEEKIKALNLQPQLHDIRQSVALYYYGIGDQGKAKSLLIRGAQQFPEHADFNLMLARIALKNDEQQRAYLYLQQNPPKVEGNLDYHVSYAILAQKFKHFEQAESLYMGLLTQRPNNGRWRMSLAIAQDKQGKERLAVESYQKALLQTDLSSNAKKYINQRLTYLAAQ